MNSVGRDVKDVSSHEHTLTCERYAAKNSMEGDVKGVSRMKMYNTQKRCSSEFNGRRRERCKQYKNAYHTKEVQQ